MIMLIHNGKAFARGFILLVSFLGIFVVFFLPVFPAQEAGGAKIKGLEYADHLFNTLSKGSSLFLDPAMQAAGSIDKPTAERTRGKRVDIEVSFKDEPTLESARTLLAEQGYAVAESGGGLKIQGDLHALLRAALADSFSTYHNRLEEVAARHNGADGRKVMKTWWSLLSAMVKPMQRAGQVEEAAAVATVVSKGIEPSYNFYGITPMRVADNIPLVAGFLLFYVVYTLWYGFAIFELFEGVGLTMKKSVKQEV
jgi:hypothetical protein